MKRLLLAFVIALCGWNRVAHAADFRFDLVHTQIFFSVSHIGYSQSTGQLHVKDGYFRFDDDDWSKAQVDATIDIGSLDMGNAPWSDKLRKAYFDVSTYPTARYVSTSVEKTGAKTGIVHGKLTLLGRSQPVDLQLTFNRAGADGYTLRYVAGFSATAKFRRSAFGMTRSDKDIGDEVTMRIEVEGIRDGDAQKKTQEELQSNRPETH
ncbi:MAG TPA: YceI family protein [Rudaea sp.]